jgi:hypothetical protein
MNTLDLKQAAAFLRMHPEEVRRHARLRLLPERSLESRGCSSRTTWLRGCVAARRVQNAGTATAEDRKGTARPGLRLSHIKTCVCRLSNVTVYDRIPE